MAGDEGMASKRGSEASLTLAILREIRDAARKTNDELKETNARLDQTNARLDQTNARLDQTNARLDGLQEEMRRGFTRLEGRIDNLLLGSHRSEHEELRGRVERLERHLGLDPR